MRGFVVHASAGLLAAASILVSGPDARACGGCFVPPKQVTVVTDHRMAFSISPQQSVLWDQVEYSGAPQDFAWVLPVMPGTQIQLSHDAFFAALDALTDPVINAPPLQCKPAAGGFACSSSSNGASFAASAAGGSTGVQVLGQSVIGPYDTATIHSTDPNALEAWLTANSYDIPDAIQPVIAAYVAQGFDFIAMRLAPGQGVQAMQPVRVVFPGASLTLPLRMVAAGVGDQVGLTLYVISEGRYEAQNFPNATFDDSKLVWLSAQSISNYEPLAEGIMQQDGGKTWLTEYSAQNEIQTASPCPTPPSPVYSNFSGGLDTEDLGALYFSTCQCGSTTLGNPDGSAPTDAGEDAGGSDASAPSVPSTSCASFDDLAVAMDGMDPTDTWVTRLRAILPSNALSEADLVLQASASQTLVSNVHNALVYDDPSYSPCSGSAASSNSASSGGGGCSAAPDDPDVWSRWLVVGSLAFAGVALGRRRFVRGQRS